MVAEGKVECRGLQLRQGRKIDRRMELDVERCEEGIVKIDFLDVGRRAVLHDRRQETRRRMGQFDRRATVIDEAEFLQFRLQVVSRLEHEKRRSRGYFAVAGRTAEKLSERSGRRAVALLGRQAAVEEVLLNARRNQVHHHLALALFIGRVGEGDDLDVNDVTLDQQLDLQIELRRHAVIGEPDGRGEIVVDTVVLHANLGVHGRRERQKAHLVHHADR